MPRRDAPSLLPARQPRSLLTQERILAAAQSLLAEGDVEAITMERIAERAHVSIGAIYKRFLGRTELFWSRRGQEGGDASAFGLYASGDYQFARRWFGGVRYDWSERAYDASLADKGPSLLLTYWPSEFSQIRGQYRRTRFAEGVTANEFLFQFLFSIGAHGAHVF